VTYHEYQHKRAIKIFEPMTYSYISPKLIHHNILLQSIIIKFQYLWEKRCTTKHKSREKKRGKKQKKQREREREREIGAGRRRKAAMAMEAPTLRNQS
jgi:hypothetical protein